MFNRGGYLRLTVQHLMRLWSFFYFFGSLCIGHFLTLTHPLLKARWHIYCISLAKLIVLLWCVLLWDMYVLK